jgi:hypothetical protein
MGSTTTAARKIRIHVSLREPEKPLHELLAPAGRGLDDAEDLYRGSHLHHCRHGIAIVRWPDSNQEHVGGWPLRQTMSR